MCIAGVQRRRPLRGGDDQGVLVRAQGLGQHQRLARRAVRESTASRTMAQLSAQLLLKQIKQAPEHR